MLIKIASKSTLIVAALATTLTSAALAIPAPASAAPTKGKPGAPRAVRARPIDSGAQLTWRPPASDGGAKITGYVIKGSPGGKVARTTNVTSFSVGGLRDGTSYRFTVTAVSRIGNGPASRPSAAVKPRHPAAPSSPRNVSASAGYKSATLRWTAPASDGGAPVTRYAITARPGHHVTTVPGDARNAVLSGLADGTAYSVTITAAGGAGVSRPSAAVLVTPAVTVPVAPGSVRVATAGTGTVDVQWVPPPSDGGSPLTGYTVSVSNGGPTSALGPSATATAISGLDPGQAYTFSVTARNDLGPGPAAGSSAVTPKAVVAAGTVVLGAQALGHLTGVLTDGALTFTSPPAQVTGLRPGDVIAAGVSPATPRGLLRQVDSVTSHGATTTVTTSPAALNQAVRTGGLALGGALGAADVASFTPARPGIRLVSGAGIGLGTSIGFSISADLYKATDDRTVHAAGMISVTPAFELSVSLNGGHVNASYQATVTEASSLTLKAELSREFSASIPLGDVTFDPIVFSIGPVPVVLVPELSLDLTADGTITVGVVTSATQSVSYGVRLASTDGKVSATPIDEHTSSFTPPTLYDSLDASAGPEADLSLLLYGLVGPYLKDELSLVKLHASTTEDPWWTLSGANVVSAGFHLSALGDDIADWSKSPLIEETWPLANAGGPFMGVLIKPDPASVAPGGSIQLSARVQRSLDQAVTWSVAPHGGTISSTGRYTAPATAGFYPVTATSAASGLKPETRGIIVVRVGAQPPGAPTHVIAVPSGPGKATLSWSRPGDIGGSAIRSYHVISFPAGGVAFVGGNDTSATVTGLTPGDTYQFALVAVNAAGPGPASAVTAPVTVPNIDPYATSSWPSLYGQLNGDVANPGETIISSATVGALHRTSAGALMRANVNLFVPAPPVVSDGFVYVAADGRLTVFNAKTGSFAYRVTLPYAVPWGALLVPGNGHAYLVNDLAGAQADGVIVAVNLATRRVAWVVSGKPCILPQGETFASGVLVTTGGDTCGINGSTGAVLWNFSFPYPDASFNPVANGSMVYLTRQNIEGDGQDFWLLGVNAATGAVTIDQFFNTAGGLLEMAGGKLVLSASTLQGNPQPALYGLDPRTGQIDWTYTDRLLGSTTTDGSSIWANVCGTVVRIDAATGVPFESVTPKGIACGGRLELAGDLLWMMNVMGPKAGQESALAFAASDIQKVVRVPLPSEASGNSNSLPVVADGHLFVVQQVGTSKWRLLSWGL